MVPIGIGIPPLRTETDASCWPQALTKWLAIEKALASKMPDRKGVDVTSINDFVFSNGISSNMEPFSAEFRIVGLRSYFQSRGSS